MGIPDGIYITMFVVKDGKKYELPYTVNLRDATTMFTHKLMDTFEVLSNELNGDADDIEIKFSNPNY